MRSQDGIFTQAWSQWGSSSGKSMLSLRQRNLPCDNCAYLTCFVQPSGPPIKAKSSSFLTDKFREVIAVNNFSSIFDPIAYVVADKTEGQEIRPLWSIFGPGENYSAEENLECASGWKRGHFRFGSILWEHIWLSVVESWVWTSWWEFSIREVVLLL